MRLHFREMKLTIPMPLYVRMVEAHTFDVQEFVREYPQIKPDSMLLSESNFVLGLVEFALRMFEADQARRAHQIEMEKIQTPEVPHDPATEVRDRPVEGCDGAQNEEAPNRSGDQEPALPGVLGVAVL